MRKVVTAAEITRYGLDIMLTKPEGMDKAEFEFIFNTTKIYEDKQIRLFADAVLAMIRDDRRPQDPLTLGGIMQRSISRPAPATLCLMRPGRLMSRGLVRMDARTMSGLC